MNRTRPEGVEPAIFEVAAVYLSFVGIASVLILACAVAWYMGWENDK